MIALALLAPPVAAYVLLRAFGSSRTSAACLAVLWPMPVAMAVIAAITVRPGTGQP
jgi:hypothetical protein